MWAETALEIEQGALALGLTLSEVQVSKLEQYLRLLKKWNRTYNLTAIDDLSQMVGHHLLDSLAVAPYINDAHHSILDVGTGAGLPGIPLAVLFPHKDFTLLDSNGKKTRFVRQATIELDLQNCEIAQQRIEQFQPQERFDLVVSRAFSKLEDFVNLAQHTLKEEALFFAMKGRASESEVQALPEGFRLQALHELQVPGLNEQRHLAIVARA